jgi:two-component system LytT family response regulator
MIKAIIIDDELASQQALQIKLTKIGSNIEIIKTFDSAKDAILEIEDIDPDLIFLDVEMPEMDGFNFLNHFPNRDFEVIITTAHTEYAVQAVRQSAIDFLLKPVIIDELKQAVDRLNQKLLAKEKSTKATYPKLNAQFDKIPVPSLRGISFLPIHNILYLSSEGNYTTLYTEGGHKIVSSRNLGDYETLLENLNFYRIHNSTIINLVHIKEYIRGDGGSVILTDGTELDVSKRKKKDFLEAIGY